MARGLARELGPRIEGLFLLCPAIMARRGDRDLPRRAVVREEPSWREEAKAAGANDADLADYEALAVVKSRDNFARVRAEIIAGIRIARLPALQRYLAGSDAFSFDAFGKVGTEGEPFDPVFEGPACFFLGRQDSSVGWRDALRLADRYPRASYHIVDGAGHDRVIDRMNARFILCERWVHPIG
jgi:hypothetical protein